MNTGELIHTGYRCKSGGSLEITLTVFVITLSEVSGYA